MFIEGDSRRRHCWAGCHAAGHKFATAQAWLMGSAKMVLETENIRGDMVCSPGGTTIEAVRTGRGTPLTRDQAGGEVAWKNQKKSSANPDDFRDVRPPTSVRLRLRLSLL